MSATVKDIKVGDKVRIKYDTAGSPVVGKVGTVVSIIPWKTYPLIVKFDEIQAGLAPISRSSMYGRNTRQFSYSEVEKVEKEAKVLDLKVIINDKAVIALLKGETGTKKGVAKCHPDDEFDPYIGLQVAISRLFGKQTPLLNGTELDKVQIHGIVDGKGVRQTIELHTGSDRYTMPVKVQD